MGLFGDLLSELKSAVQLAGRIDEKVDGLTTRVAANEEDTKVILAELGKHGERIARLEKGEETLEERTKLYLERALAQHSRTDGPSLPPQLGP